MTGGLGGAARSTRPFTLGIVTGLMAEARLADPLGRARAAGGMPAGAAAAASALADEGATALLSFGLAGGLSPSLAAGTLLIPAMIVTDKGRCETDAALNAWLGGTTGHVLAAGTQVAATRAEKHALAQRTGAHAVDLESGAVMDVARLRGLPFAALRVVCDPAGSDLPPAALVALGSSGRIGLLRVLASLMRQPGQFGALLRLSGQARLARATLVRHVAAITARGEAPAP